MKAHSIHHLVFMLDMEVSNTEKEQDWKKKKKGRVKIMMQDFSISIE